MLLSTDFYNSSCISSKLATVVTPGVTGSEHCFSIMKNVATGRSSDQNPKLPKQCDLSSSPTQSKFHPF